MKFTSREKEVIEFVVKGLSNKDIAAALFIQEITVKIHLNHIYSKLGIKGRAQLFLFYYTGIDKNIKL